MATPNQIKSLTALYIGYFDRAPDPAGLQFWIDQLNNGREFATIAQDFATSPEAKAIYPFLANPGVASAESFIANIYDNLFDRAPDAAGLAFWSGVLESGSVPVGDMIAAIIEGAQGADKALVDNLTEVALGWTETVAGTRGFEWNEDAAAASRDILAGVTADDAAVVAAQNMTDTYAATFGPQPFTLSVEGGAVMEGNAGAKSLSFVLTLGSQPTSDVVVNYKTLTSGTATQDDDFSASMGSVTFKAGEMQKIVTVSVLGDSVVEGNETVNVLFSGARLTAPVTASGTIVNDDNTPIGAVRDVTAAANIVSEAAPVGATVGLRAQATDVDAGSAVTYSLDDDADGLFTINAVTGTVTLAAPVDYEQATSHAITVRATSSDGTFSVQDFTVAVTNANDNALTLVADINAAANVVAETAVEGSVVGITALATDADAGATVRYALTDNAGGRFAIHAETGVVTVAKAGEFDFEAAQSHDITVTATSSDGAVTTQVMTIAVTDMPDPVQVLTTGTDTLSLGRQDNLIVGSNGHHGNTTTATYNSSDIIDGGAGTDTLQLELSSNGYFDGDDLYDFAMSGASQLEVVNLRDYNGDGYTAASPVVRNVEILDVNIDSNVYIYDEESLVDFPLDFDFSFLASVIVDMSRFDTALEQINLVDTEGSVFILDQQSVADVLIRDTNGSVYLDYDSQVVGNTGGHQVNVTIDEFGHNFTVGGGAGGVGSSFKPALVVNDVPTIVLNVADGIGENSAFVLASQGANTPNQVGITGGIASQGVVIDTHLNVGSSVYATSFAGDLYLANDGGGDVKDVYAIDFNNVAAGVTTSMTLVADGVTHTVGFTASETMTADEVKATIARLANEVETWKEIGFVVGTGSEGRLGLESSVSNLASVSGSQADTALTVTELPETVDVSSELRTVSLGAGDDELLIFSGDVTRRDRIDLGEGGNTMSLMDGDPAGGNVFGTVSAGDGDDDIQVTHLIGGAVVLGGGTNTVGAEGITGTLTTGDGDDVLRTEFIGHVESNENFGATVDLGDGNNVVDVTGAGIGDGATLTTGAGNDELTIGDGLLSGNAQVDLGDGTNRVVISGIEDNAHLAFGDGDANEVNTGSIAGNENRVSITFGDGDHNALFVGGDIGSSVHRGDITFGDGDGQYFASGTVTDSSITMGDGDNNGIGIYGDFTGFGATTINLGNGDNSSVYIAGAMIDETINGGTGDNTTIMIGEDVVGSTLNLAGGDTVLSISGSVGHGSSITMSDEADLLGMSEVHSSGTQTVVALNGGDDTVVLYNTDGDGEDGLIQSGAVVQGGEGDDTLVVMADEDTDVVARSKAQVVTIRVQANDATGNFAVGNAASVVIAGVVYTYVVKASDIVQGDGAATALNVAIGLETALDASPMESVVRVGSEITLTGVTGDADLAISAETDGAGSVEAEVVQIADVAITGFETLDLHTAYDTYAVSGYESGAENVEVMFQNGGEDDDGNVRADFDFIDGVETVNMTSHSALTTVTHSADTPGQYEANAVGRAVMFDLDNLDGGETLIVSGDEVTATGNQAVYRFTVTAIDDANQIGDVLTATVNGIAYSITITEDDLATSDAAQTPHASRSVLPMPSTRKASRWVSLGPVSRSSGPTTKASTSKSRMSVRLWSI